jgi:SnoaL-like domain
MATIEENIQMVCRYINARNTGEIDVFSRTLDPEVVAYFLSEGLKPIHGSTDLTLYLLKHRQLYDPVWRVDHIVGSGSEVVCEWSCAYRLSQNTERMIYRGTTWFIMRDSRIAEVRAHYGYDGQHDRDNELMGFPYAARGYLMKNAL